jgi:amino acid adenylation domain-containing protein
MNAQTNGLHSTPVATPQQRRLLRLGGGDERSPFVSRLKLRVVGANPRRILEVLRDIAVSADVLLLELRDHPVLDSVEASLSHPTLDSSSPSLRLPGRADWTATLSAVSDQAFELELTVPAYCADAQSMLTVARELWQRAEVGAEPMVAPSFWEVREWWADLLTTEAAFTGLAYWRERQRELGTEASALAGLGDWTSFRPATRRRTLPLAVLRLISELEAEAGESERGAVLIAAWATVVARRFGYSGPMGVTLPGRGEAELHDVIGPLARTAPLGCRYSPTRSFASAVREVSFSLFEAHAWQDYFCAGAGEDGESADTERLFAPYAYERAPRIGALGGPNVQVEVIDVASVGDRFLLRLRDEGESIGLDFDASRISPTLADCVLDALLALLTSAAEAPQTNCGALPFASASELELASRIAVFSDDSARVTAPILRFEEVVRRVPDRIAVQREGRSVTYTMLDRMARNLAARLVERGAGPERLVALHLGTSLELIVGVLATLKLEAPFVPIDPFLPMMRRVSLLSQLEPCAVVSSALEPQFAGLPCGQCLAIDPVPASESGERVESRTGDPELIAYAMFTSGSTGVPKCAAIPARALNNQIDWFVRTFELGAEDRILVRTLPSFDAFIWEVIAPVCAGATAVLTEGGSPLALDAVVRSICLGEVSHFQFTPHLLRGLVREAPFGATPRRIYCGGEILDAELVRQARACFGADVVNLYGPCETCVQVTSFSAETEELQGIIPVGHAMANVGLAVVDDAGQICPFGVEGELLISGAALARGYLANPRATAELFVPDAHGAVRGARAYRSGDRAKQALGGEIVVLGRTDSQIKIRGARVELAEVRRELLRVCGVRDCAVVVSGSVEKALVAVLEPEATDVADDVEARAREHARAHLPPWMVPASVVMTTALPRLPSGKVDSEAVKSLIGGRTREAPGSPSEQRLAEMWRELLRLKFVGRHDNFFEIGGQSLLLMRLASRIRETFGVDAPLMDIYGAKTLMQMAELIDRLGARKVHASP